jgi:hypothetical protein
MWDWIIHLMIGMLLGWYLNPFKNGYIFRHKVNELIGKLVSALIGLLNQNKKPKRRQRTLTKQDNDQTQAIPSIKSSHTCSKCGGVLEPIDNYKGFGCCLNCGKVDPMTAGARR